jgi:hypothetical protein
MQPNKNLLWRSVDRCMIVAYTEDRLRKLAQADLETLRPWLRPTEGWAGFMDCPNSRSLDSGCMFKIHEVNDDKFVGVCINDVCNDRRFTRTELTQFTVNWQKLAKALAPALGFAANTFWDEFGNTLKIGTIATEARAVGIHLLGGGDYRQQLDEIRKLWEQGDSEQIYITPVGDSISPDVDRFLNRIGWPRFILEGNLELTAAGVTWLPGGRERWEQLLVGIKLTQVGEVPAVAAYKHTVAIAERIERKVEAVGMDMSTLRKENESLRLQLGNQLTSLAGQVNSEFFHWVCTVLVEGSMHRASKRLDLPHTTFRERFNRYVQKGGIYRSLAKLIEVRRSGLGSRKLEALNATFGRHQKSAEPVYDNRAVLELLDALKSLNEDNWEDVRDEMLEVLAELQG